MSKSKYIMLADDDEDDRLLFEEALFEVCQNSKIITTCDGIDSLDTLNQKCPPYPDVLFLDINMPRLNGFECLEKIRSSEKLKHLLIIMFSTSNNQENIDTAYKLGANYYIHKPSSFSDLKKIISKVYEMPSYSLFAINKNNFLLTV